jgi:hypothetical protein
VRIEYSRFNAEVAQDAFSFERQLAATRGGTQ